MITEEQNIKTTRHRKSKRNGQRAEGSVQVDRWEGYSIPIRQKRLIQKSELKIQWSNLTRWFQWNLVLCIKISMKFNDIARTNNEDDKSRTTQEYSEYEYYLIFGIRIRKLLFTCEDFLWNNTTGIRKRSAIKTRVSTNGINMWRGRITKNILDIARKEGHRYRRSRHERKIKIITTNMSEDRKCITHRIRRRARYGLIQWTPNRATWSYTDHTRSRNVIIVTQI